LVLVHTHHAAMMPSLAADRFRRANSWNFKHLSNSRPLRRSAGEVDKTLQRQVESQQMLRLGIVRSPPPSRLHAGAAFQAPAARLAKAKPSHYK
jgi:hypothetical protein